MNTPQYGSFALIPHPNENALLVVSGKLPYFETDTRYFWQDVGFITASAREALGLEVTALRCLATEYLREANLVVTAYAMENHTPVSALPLGGEWIGRDHIRRIDPDHQGIAAAWFDWVESRSALRVPWYTPGWYAEAVTWAAEQLRQLGYPEIREIRQVRCWQRSCVLRISTLAGDVYFKAVPTMFRHEPKLTQWMARGYPRRSPRVLTIDDARHWMLLRDFGSETLDKVADTVFWADAIRRFGRLQFDLAHESAHLLDLSCPDRRVALIAEDIEPLMADEGVFLPGQEGGLSREEIAALRGMVQRLRTMCDELAEIGIPDSLEHGDFYPGQVAISEGQYLFFDWSDASLSHPFFSLANLLDFMDDERPDIPVEERERIVEAYFEAWQPYAPPEQLQQALRLARPLGALHGAILYHKFILPWMEIKWEMERMIPFYLRKLLVYMRDQT